VSCSSATSCAAVGWYDIAGSPRAPLAEVWDGVRWMSQGIVLPSGIQSDGYGLSYVSCPSTTSCIAVGSAYDTAAGNEVPLAEIWDGVRWTSQSIVLPSGLRYEFPLNSVSCPSTTSCVAVGSAYDGAAGKDVPLAEVWDGVRWTHQDMALPSGTTFRVSQVACPSTTSCTAVGFYNTANDDTIPLAEVWDGVRWTQQNIVLPSGMYSVSLSGVSCASITSCTVLGSRFVGHWDGATWSFDRDFPLGRNFPQNVPDLASVSCTSTTTCTVIAKYDLPPPVAFRSSWTASRAIARWTSAVPKLATSR
jgi:hypothetical protein